MGAFALDSVFFHRYAPRGSVGTSLVGVFFDHDRILIRRSLTRHGESSPKSKMSFRYVQMLPRVREELLSQRDRVKLRSEFVFPNRSWKGLNVNWVTKALRPRLVEKAKVSYRLLMQTRHTHARLMLQKGAPIDWLQRQMGHRNLSMLIRHYWRWINPGESRQETLTPLGAIRNSSNQPHPRPMRAFSREA
jgi:integrase